MIEKNRVFQKTQELQNEFFKFCGSKSAVFWHHDLAQTGGASVPSHDDGRAFPDPGAPGPGRKSGTVGFLGRRESSYSGSGRPDIFIYMPSHGGGTNRGGQIKRENPGFGGSGRPRAAGKPLKNPTFLRGFPPARGHPDPQNPRFSLSICPPR